MRQKRRKRERMRESKREKEKEKEREIKKERKRALTFQIIVFWKNVIKMFSLDFHNHSTFHSFVTFQT